MVLQVGEMGRAKSADIGKDIATKKLKVLAREIPSRNRLTARGVGCAT